MGMKYESLGAAGNSPRRDTTGKDPTVQEHYTASPSRTSHSYEELFADALLAQHGGRNRLRLISDEELFRARLAFRREEVTAADWFVDLHPLAACQRLDALRLAREAVEQEETRRERARVVGVPRDGGAGWVPDAIIEAIRTRLSPVDVFHRYGLTELREIGRGKWVGKCPFHDDGSPSLYVYTADANDLHWHCFGCQAHGDVFDLARRHFGLGFQEVCEGLASIAGVPWLTPEPPKVAKIIRFGEIAERAAHGR